MTTQLRAGRRGELDAQYSPSSLVPATASILERYTRDSAAARELLEHHDIAYGPSPVERLDFFPARTASAPFVVFVHGGFWQELGRSDSAFLAPGVHSAGAAFAALGYGLAPEHGLGEIVAMVRRGVRWLQANAAALGADPERIHLVGSSAGAHLVASCLLPEATGAAEARETATIRGATLLSGVYDLEPLVDTYVNAALGLDRRTARRYSPVRFLPAALPALIVARGSVETAEFARQHEEFTAQVRRRSTDLVDAVVEGRNHFDVVFDLVDPTTSLGRVFRARIGDDA